MYGRFFCKSSIPHHKKAGEYLTTAFHFSTTSFTLLFFAADGGLLPKTVALAV
jgi:hypothetical protein